MNKLLKNWIIYMLVVFVLTLTGTTLYLLNELNNFEERLSSYAGAEMLSPQRDNELYSQIIFLQEEIASINFEVFDRASESWEYGSPENSRMDWIEHWLDLNWDHETNRITDIINLEADLCAMYDVFQGSSAAIYEPIRNRESNVHCMPWYTDKERTQYDRIEFDIEDLDTVQELIVGLETAISAYEEMEREHEDLFFKVWYMWEEIYLFDNDFTDSPETDADGNYMSFTDFTMYGFTSTSTLETMVEDGWRDETSRIDALFDDMYPPPTFAGDYNDSWDYNIVYDNITALHERLTALELIVEGEEFNDVWEEMDDGFGYITDEINKLKQLYYALEEAIK